MIREAIDQADLVIVGSGFFGTTIAELAARQGYRSVVLEKRNHIGGNSYSYIDSQTGIEVHKYGSHLFHTSNEKVWQYVNQFANFNDYRHTVFTIFENKIYSLPINLSTICNLFNTYLTPEEARQLILKQTSKYRSVKANNFEAKALQLIGPTIYESLFKGYTIKQWGINPTKLPAEVLTRLPVRFTFNNRYFNDKWEGLPVDGYQSWFQAMLKSPLIKVITEIDFFEVKNLIGANKLVVYTGPIDRYFAYSEGELGWRTLNFELCHLDIPDFQGTAVINYADVKVPYTRIHEFRHLHPERAVQDSKTVIMREYSRFSTREDEPYYPLNTSQDRIKLKEYRLAIKAEQKNRKILFGGRLGSYQYLDMHMAIASALSTFESEVLPLLKAKN